ncbi:hypothetical protein PV413_03645 [Streptomyces scabiei]|uniref:hypothetical protein n=1 Tax=Streptomyces scabiei TaxID=1930 RepID=UPI000E68135C|nr:MULTISPECIES: hypothetical protein [Streptomyces]MDX2749663.1 hypothetical protein [Streptomyces scabiei]MDX3033349.1 hypothetical protein [Streptomyces scabiei]MDX3146568.1 hypothetical protein [Streptomyces scabiei]MDX3196875.1 hypothetical protein [Streptomyces scabiei]MDX3212331.1 hypothetical protein [Streptomyces scabiei]
MTAVRVCSLITSEPQLIPPGGYHVVRFPYAGESYDAHDMHAVEQPDGYVVGNWSTDDRSGLIWPSDEGWGSLTAVIQWEAGGYSELRDQYIRDPLGLTDDPRNTTGTDHRPPSPGMQCWTKHHECFVHPGQPLALRVSHNDTGPRRLLLAQFKLAIHS